MKRIIVLVFMVAVTSLILTGCGDTSPQGTSNQKEVTTASTPAPTPAPAPTVKTYSDGMYKIGDDMPAKEYVLVSDSSAYFQIAKNSTGELDSILANDNFTNRSIITVSSGQYLTLRNCTAYAFEDAPKIQPSDGFLSEGMYKVGIDLPAGEYKVILDKDAIVNYAYVEVSTNSTHGLDSIVSNDNFQTERYITVKNGQYIKLNNAKLKLN